MAKTASREKKDRSRHWQRAATRASILEAARRLIARVGTDNLSLTAVAREADFAPTTVFAYYANKNDLFLSVLAADLANFARTMREYGGPAEQDISPDEEVATASAGVTTAPIAPETYPPSVSEDAPRLRLVETQQFDPDAAAGEAPDWASQEEIATLLRDELARDTDPSAPAENGVPATTAAVSGDVPHELAELRAAVAKLETRPVDQWLERRLREFERGLTALEGRPEKAEIAATLTDLNDNLRKLGTRLDTIERRQAQSTDDVTRAMRERDEQIEKRQREFLSDVEAANARATTRLNALENAAFAVAPEYFPTAAAKAPPETPAPAPVVAVAEPISSDASRNAAPDAASNTAPDDAANVAPDAPVGDVPAANIPDSAAAEPAPSYLSAARRSALAAAQDGAGDTHKTQRSRRLSKRTLYMVAAGLGLVVVLVWAGVFVKALAVPAPQRLPERTPIVAKAQKLALKPDAQTVLLQAARAGNARAELAVALNLLGGPRKNEALAARWLTAAAQRGDAVAAFKLATLYRSGRGVAADAGQSLRWFETAARKGNTKAMQDLAVAYAEGWGTDKNPSEAARWFTRAADLGLTDAQFNLGVLYEEGLGVPQSLLDAYKWYLIAAGAGDREAETRVDAIKPQLSSSDVAAAEEAAASFKPASPDRDANVAPSAPQLSAG